MSSIRLSSFEADLLRLLIASLRLWTIHLEFHKQTGKNKHSSFMRQLLRDVAIEQLHNFIKIRRDLLKNPKFKKLDDILFPLIKELVNYQDVIKEMRDNYVSHIQEQGRKFKENQQEIVMKYDLPTNFAFWSYLCQLAFTYWGHVNSNFESEGDKAMKKYEASRGASISNSSGYNLKDVEQKTRNISLHVLVDLHKNGYVSVKDVTLMKKFLEHYSAN